MHGVRNVLVFTFTAVCRNRSRTGEAASPRSLIRIVEAKD